MLFVGNIRYNKTMADKEYVPDEQDKNWLKGLSHEPLNPHHDSYEARMKWRHEQTLLKQAQKKQVVIDADTLKATAIAIVIILALIFLYHRGSTGANAGGVDNGDNNGRQCFIDGDC